VLPTCFQIASACVIAFIGFPTSAGSTSVVLFLASCENASMYFSATVRLTAGFPFLEIASAIKAIDSAEARALTRIASAYPCALLIF